MHSQSGRLAQLVQSIPITSGGSLTQKVKKREISSAGSEHLPYKQGVTGSNPVSPTLKIRRLHSIVSAFFYAVYTLVYTNLRFASILFESNSLNA